MGWREGEGGGGPLQAGKSLHLGQAASRKLIIQIKTNNGREMEEGHGRVLSGSQAHVCAQRMRFQCLWKKGAQENRVVGGPSTLFPEKCGTPWPLKPFPSCTRL